MKKKTEPKKNDGRPECQHLHTDEVRSANGGKLYGWRCPACTKQWQRDICTDCQAVERHVARIDKKTWTCRKCKRARLMAATGKGLPPNTAGGG